MSDKHDSSALRKNVHCVVFQLFAALLILLFTASAAFAAEGKLQGVGVVTAGGGQPANVEAGDDGWTLTGTGTFGDREDRYALQAFEASGDFEFSAKISPRNGKDGYAGIIICPAVGRSNQRGFVGIKSNPEGSGNFRISFRQVQNGLNSERYANRNHGDAATWLKIVRAGNTVTYYWSAEGEEWAHLGFSNDFVPALPDTVVVGLTVIGDETVTADFSRVSVKPFTPDYETLWIGNSNPTWTGYIQEGMICLDYSTESGLLYGGGYSESNGVSIYTQDGDRIYGERGVAHFTACKEILVHDGLIYGSFVGGGIRVWNEYLQRDPSHESFAKDSKFAGLATDGRLLYAGDMTREEIRVFDLEDRSEVLSWQFKRPGFIQFDGEGNLWIEQRAEEEFVPVRVNAGGNLIGWRRAHEYVQGGKYSWRWIDDGYLPQMEPKGLVNPAPTNVYRSWFGGDHSYRTNTRGGTGYLNRDLQYKIRLHLMAPLPKVENGEHVFDVLVNGETVLDDYDLVAEAGGYLKPIIKEFITTPKDYALTVSLKSEKGVAVSCGAEFLCIDPPIKGKMLQYTKDGQRLPTTIDFDEIKGWVHPEGFAIHPKTGNLYICDSGPSQCIWIYSQSGEYIGHFGEIGGIYSGRPGEIKPKKFNHPIDLEFDPKGNLYVVGDVKDMNFWGGSELRKFDPDGNLVWEKYGLEYTTLPDFDPAGDGEEIWGPDQHYVVDYSKPAGEHWLYAGYTADRFTYPNDPRRNGGGNNGCQVRRIDGRRITFVEQMGGGELTLYRYEPGSDIALGCGWFVPYRFSLGYWYDRNGDAERQQDEILHFPIRGFDGNPWVDSRGDIWFIGTDQEDQYQRYVCRLRCQGLNEHGVPRYAPEAFDKWAVDCDVKRMCYDAADDALYLVGNENIPTFGGAAVVMNRYDKVVADGGTLQKRYSALLVGWDRVRQVATGEAQLTTGWHGGSDRVASATLAGKYVFLGTLMSHAVLIYEKQTGILVDRLIPQGKFGVNAGWIDIAKGVHAIQRKNGEYVILVEDDMKGVSTLYRWRPDENPAEVVDLEMRPRLHGASDHVQVDWRGRTEPVGVIEGYHLYRSTNGGDYVRLTDAPVRAMTYSDRSAEIGQTYSYRVSVINAAGEGKLSPPQSITSAPATAKRVTSGRFAPDGFDQETLGSWKGVYGQDGFCIAGEYSARNKKNARRKDPDYARLHIPLPDFRADVVQSDNPVLLETSAEGNTRAQGSWSKWGDRDPVRIDLDFQDGKPHRVAVYNRPEGQHGTASRIELLDAATGEVLDAVQIIHKDMDKGQYVAWNVTGHVILQVSTLPVEMKREYGVHGAAGCHIQGIFFDPAQ